MDKIDDLRLLIDELDNNIMSMLDKRFNLSNEIGNIKAHAKTAVLDT
ncbi:MAG: chorismate mutase, partial [Candidatus Izimaplasma sp.]|nr:chorismate mutase [Candidatus Izimaplasma bacterium]